MWEYFVVLKLCFVSADVHPQPTMNQGPVLAVGDKINHPSKSSEFNEEQKDKLNFT
jgi:hypothetical protein